MYTTMTISTSARMETTTRSETRCRTSVVLASHNGEAFIWEQLQSLAKQAQKPFEIIVSDDASCDRTVSIVKDFAKSVDIPVHLYLNDPALGFGENFLSAASHAKGELVAFCDQDDVWHPDKICLCSDYFGNRNTVLAVHKSRLIDSAGNLIGSFTQDITSDNLLPPLSCGPWDVFFGFSMVFRRSLLNVLPRDRRGADYILGHIPLSHDRWILYLANMLGQTQEINVALTDYRQHTHNTFGKFWKVKKDFEPHLVCQESERYVASSHRFRSLVDAIRSDISTDFPLFNRSACQQFWNKAVAQQVSRRRIYTSATKTTAFSILCFNVLGPTYHNVNNGRLRWRSIGKDLAYIARSRQAVFMEKADQRPMPRSEEKVLPQDSGADEFGRKAEPVAPPGK
jgi:glycosyltransferase involved in cell wall biosynthesis